MNTPKIRVFYLICANGSYGDDSDIFATSKDPDDTTILWGKSPYLFKDASPRVDYPTEVLEIHGDQIIRRGEVNYGDVENYGYGPTSIEWDAAA